MNLRAVIYLRVSDPSQIENNSLETQRKACELYAKQHGYIIVHEPFRDEGVSAKHTESRPELRKLMNFCTTKKNAVNAVIVYKIDRWTRNVQEGLAAISLLARSGVEVVSTEGFEDNPMGRALRNIMMTLAELDNGLKGERVKDNMKLMFQKGLWCWKPPPGYKRPFDMKEKNKGLPPIIDTQLAGIIKNLFEESSKGIYSRPQLIRRANALGFGDHFTRKLDQPLFIKILTNPFYYGMMYAKKWDEQIQGLHEPLVNEELWHEAQYRVFGKKRKGLVKISI